MNNKNSNINMNTNNIILLVLIIILIFICLFFYQNYQERMNQVSLENKETQIFLKEKIKNLEKNMNDSKKQVEKYDNNINNTDVIIPNLATNNLINKNPQSLNALDRIYNPLRYPYKSDYFYDQNWYPNLNLPSQVVVCGSRRQPCLGGTQVPIYNPPTPIDISDNNIAPVYISTRGPLGQPQQVGILYKIFGNENDTLPLYGRKKYPNDTKYEYYTVLGNYSTKVPIVIQNKNLELGTNDVVFIKGRGEPYRVTIYESDFPQYIPYL
jgi:hypothetical protein